MRYHNITKDDMLNGDGLRAVLWVAGCTHGCNECHNPITWDPRGGLLFDEDAKAELEKELKKEYINGITFSGGDPLHPDNVCEIQALAKEFKDEYPQKTIWLYTGELWENISNIQLMNDIDVLVDGKFDVKMKSETLQWKGSENQRVIDVQRSLKQREVVLHETNSEV